MMALGIPVGLVLSFVTFVACKGFGFQGGHGMLTPERLHQIIDWKFDDAMEMIDASDEQRTKMDDIKERMIADAVSMHGELDDAHEIMLEEWKSETPNLGTIDTQIDAGMELKKGFARKIAGTLLEVHDILTPEQREIVSAQIEEHMSHMRQFLKTR